MTKGTAARGAMNSGKTHIMCRRCGKHSYNMRAGVCASCGFGKSSKMREYRWQKESKR
ncbi:MAG: 50S ribosomal protein L37e [Candidatus Woesearchaeota archaeon]